MTESDDEYQFAYDISNEIACFRRRIRSSGYFKNPYTSKKHTSLSGNPLDNGLLQLIDYCNTNKNLYMEDLSNKNKDKLKLIPIFVTPEQRKKYCDITNIPKSDLVQIVDGIVRKLKDHILDKNWKSIKVKSKAVILQFKSEIEELLDNELAD